ncbi:MAG: diadenylate cyclase CdaA, partial [Candidatus Eremiobacteraeota bacterium]|nr:diadenylate cyclase CdaA [Candidatus Eremiobacteraeota bacterium]
MDAFNGFLSSLGPTDLLDVIATSVLIYYVLLLIRGTRAVQILIGVLVLIGLLGLANLLRLYLLGSILQIIVVGAAVTLPIVFQPELRRALEQLGRGGLFRLSQDDKERRPEDRSILAIAQVAFALSRSRIGALIVIEQQSGLKEFVETGTLLNALVSVELLVSLFQPRSPLHDGAVIVQEDLIEAAGCFLPLAEQSLAERRVGTRHRAALGLSEQTDAVVVVVSEE